VGRVEIVENPEDELIRHAVNTLVDYYGLKGWLVERPELEAGIVKDKWPDAFLVYGASSPVERTTGDLRALVEKLSGDKPVIYLPGVYLQSMTPPSRHETFYTSNPAWDGLARPAPEMTLALDGFFPLEPARRRLGVFLARDSIHDQGTSLGDPVSLSPDCYFYLRLATYFEELVTDRLRFAIAGLIAGRRVTLLPERDGINRSAYQDHLRQLGCRWRDEPDPVDYDPRTVQRADLRSFCAAVPGKIDRLSIPLQMSGFNVQPVGAEAELHAPGGETRPCSYSIFLLWELCDGDRTVEDIIGAIVDHVPGEPGKLAGDVDAGLNMLLALSAIELRRGYTDTNGRRHYADRRSAPVEVQVKSVRRSGDSIVLSADLKSPGGTESTLWFEVPERFARAVGKRADPFLLASLYTAMKSGRELIVRGGTVSESLLWNLDEYQQAFACSFSQYRAITVHAETCDDETTAGRPAISCYSGGVDSTFSVFHHSSAGQGTSQQPLGAALMVLGLDIPAQDRGGFVPLANAAERLLGAIDMPLLTLRTNIRTTCSAWEVFHAPFIASCLTLFNGGHSTGFIPSTFHYRSAVIEGSNPITDHLLGSRSFPIVNHGAAFTRFQKIEALVTRWPDAIDGIRVCWRQPVRSENCGRCWKCLQTAMCFHACGVTPASLSHVTDEDIAAYIQRSWLPSSEYNAFTGALDAVKRYGVRAPWTKVLKGRIEGLRQVPVPSASRRT